MGLYAPKLIPVTTGMQGARLLGIRKIAGGAVSLAGNINLHRLKGLGLQGLPGSSIATNS